MKKMRSVRSLGVLGLTVLCFLVGNSFAFARGGGAGHAGGGAGHAGGMGHNDSGTPSGFSQGEKKGWEGKSTPPGWSHGKKTGWHGADRPPGLEKKQNETAKETEKK